MYKGGIRIAQLKAQLPMEQRTTFQELAIAVWNGHYSLPNIMADDGTFTMPSVHDDYTQGKISREAFDSIYQEYFDITNEIVRLQKEWQ